MSHVKVKFEIKFGFLKVNKIREFAMTIDQIYEKVKAKKGYFYLMYFKKSWSTTLCVEVEGEREAVKDFLRELRMLVGTFGVKVIPENWWEV